MTPDKFRQLVGNKFFTVSFTKKDGSIRVMNARLNVKKHLKGGELSYNPDKVNNIIVYDLNNKGYRTINLDALKTIKLDGYTVIL